MSLLKIGLATLFICVAPTQQKIEQPTNPCPPYGLIRLSVDPFPDSADWVIFGPGMATTPDYEVFDGGRRMVFAAPPGVYNVICATMTGTNLRLLHAAVEVASPTSTPEPDKPDPKPDPDKPPGPDTKPKPTTAVEVAAQNYAKAVRLSLFDVATLIEQKEITTAKEAVDFVSASRDAARTELGIALNEATLPLLDEQGQIKDPKAYADIMRQAARYMQESIPAYGFGGKR